MIQLYDRTTNVWHLLFYIAAVASGEAVMDVLWEYPAKQETVDLK